MKKLAMVLIVIAMAGSVVNAQHPGGRGRHGDDAGDVGNPLLMAPWERIKDSAEDFNITESQLNAIYQIREKMQETNRLIHNDVQKLRIDMHELMIQTNPDQLDKALKTSDQIHNLMGKIRTNTLKAVFELKGILSPEQQKQIRENFREHRKEMKERGQRSGRGGMKHGNRRFDKDESEMD